MSATTAVMTEAALAATQAEIDEDNARFAAYGVRLEAEGQTTKVFKHGNFVGSFTIDVERKTLRFSFPQNKFFNYFAYIASDLVTNRVRWVNENLGKDTMDQVQAGVAFLGFQKFEEAMARYVRQHPDTIQ